MTQNSDQSIVFTSNPWKIPDPRTALSGWLEGNPTEQQRQDAIAEATAARNKWKPSPEALQLVEKLKAFIGSRVRLQFWCSDMWWNEVEGAYPCELNCEDVVVLTDGEFPQAFLVVSDVVEFPNEYGFPAEDYFQTRNGNLLAPVADLYEIAKIGK